jgi:hypothetical protein
MDPHRQDRVETKLFTATQDFVLDVSGNINVAKPLNDIEA